MEGAGRFVITAGEGLEGSNGLVLTPLAANRTITFDPTSNELPGFDGNSSVVEVSFQYRFLEEPNSGLKGALAAVLFGFDETSGQRRGAVRFAILRNGGLTYSDGPSTSRLALLNDREPYDVASKETVTKVSAILDYSSKTYSFSINDVTQSQTYSFFNKTLSGITICIQNIGDENDQQRVVFDNFSVALRP